MTTLLWAANKSMHSGVALFSSSTASLVGAVLESSSLVCWPRLFADQ